MPISPFPPNPIPPSSPPPLSFSTRHGDSRTRPPSLPDHSDTNHHSTTRAPGIRPPPKPHSTDPSPSDPIIRVSVAPDLPSNPTPSNGFNPVETTSDVPSRTTVSSLRTPSSHDVDHTSTPHPVPIYSLLRYLMMNMKISCMI